MRRPVYIFSSGELHREGNTLVLIKEGSKRFVPITAVSEIYVFGECKLNKRLLEFLSSNEVIVHFSTITVFILAVTIRAHTTTQDI